MAHCHREVLFHPAAADPHDRGNLALGVTLDPVEPQRLLGARRQFADRLLDDCRFLLANERFVDRFGGIGAVQCIAFVVSPVTEPRPVAGHGSLAPAAAVENEVVGHAEQIGATIGNRAGDCALGLDPQLLDQVVGFFAISAARGEKAEQFGAMEYEQPGKAARGAIV